MQLINAPFTIKAAGNMEKIIEEYIGVVSTGTAGVSIAIMNSPSGWSEPGQTPDFDEYSIVLSGELHVKCRDGERDVPAGQGIIITKGEWVQYSTPHRNGARYLSVCVPAFTPASVHRDE